ncbi:hypothetical protein ACH4GM_41115, partial [Streptomyces coeruleorubidus]
MTSDAAEPPSSTPPWAPSGPRATSAPPLGCPGLHRGGHTPSQAPQKQADPTPNHTAQSPRT